jgi:phosphoglycerol transferase MdoB-like AlkP superfamily enzyme
MKRVFAALIKYLLFWFCYFLFFRLLFLIYNFDKTVQMGLSDFFGAFVHGSRMDLSMAAYITVIPGLLLVISPFVSHRIISIIIRWYTILILVIATFFGILDMGLYSAWGTRLDAQVVPYLTDLTGIRATVSIWMALIALIAEAAIVTGFLFLFNRIFSIPFIKAPSARWYAAPVMLFLTAALIIPVRGGLNTAPLNFGTVYFSENLFSNHAAYNYLWSFNHALLHKKVNNNNLHYFSDEECRKNIAPIYNLNQEQPPLFIRRKNGDTINVIFVMLESFSDKVIKPLGGLPDITPCLNKLCGEGILFSSFYATGNRSDKGISSFLASYPALIKASSIILYPEKMKKLSFLPDFFRKKGYNLSFYYGGDVNFYNTSIILVQSGVKNIVSRTDFPLQIATKQKWGVPDQYLYQRAFEDMEKMKQPFFSMVYNISSHEPFDVPGFSRIKGKSASDMYCNSVAYADSCLGIFVNNLKRSPLWKNTLVIISADHTSLKPGPTTFRDTATYKIPMLWLGGVVDTTFVCNKLAMQTDLGPTLIQQLGWTPEPSYFSKNMFGSKNYAFFLHNEGWGFVSKETGFFIDLQAHKQEYYYGENNPKRDSLVTFAKSFVQYLHTDFQNK